jgi:hypothetical protein
MAWAARSAIGAFMVTPEATPVGCTMLTRMECPGLRLEVVAGSGHAVQSDQPLELTRLIEDFVFGTA